DTYMHSSTKQPYSFLVFKTKDLENEVLRIDSIINEFNNYLGSLKGDTENAYSKICEYFIKLKDAQAEVRDIAVNEFSLLMKNRFDTAYDYLERIGDIIKVKPIDVAAANDTLLAADELINELLRDVKKQSDERQYAEETIVYANQYLQDFAEVSYTLKSASESFFQGHFTDTIGETVGMIKRIRPEVANEE
ncbi:MAG: septation ring formation regulator EzrA, partial [Bacilli bacterium]